MMAIALALMMPARPTRVLLWVGALLLVGAWVPVVAVGLVDPSSEYVGNDTRLGLLAWLGSTLGLMMAVVGILWQMTIDILKQVS